jgi:hypothetical protein
MDPPTVGFTAKVEGGRLPCLPEIIPRSKLKSTLNLDNTDDPAIASLQPDIRAEVDRLLDSARIISRSPAAVKRETIRRRENIFMNQTNGIALSTMAKTNVCKRDYLWHGTLNGKTTINSLKILSGTIPTKLNLNRGNTTPENIRCSHVGDVMRELKLICTFCLNAV